MGKKKKKYYIIHDGEEWEFLYKALNKRAFKNEAGEKRLLAHWQVVQGWKEYRKVNKDKRLKEC